MSNLFDDAMTDKEKDILKVAKMGIDKASALPSLEDDVNSLDNRISKSETLLESLGCEKPSGTPESADTQRVPDVVVVRSFEALLNEANEKYPDDVSFTDIFTREEIAENYEYIKALNEEFNSIHRLDKIDIAIPAIAGILGGVIDCAFGGFSKLANGKSVPGPFSQYFEELFDKALPQQKIEFFENLDLAKVTYDATDNRNTTVYVDTLSTHFHRLLSVGHDPILGFIVGTLDMLRGTMTTLDFKGKFVIQAMDAYDNRKAQDLFEAISRVFVHMLSDVNTPQGLPVPFMALFNKLQLGSIGDEKLNIPEMVKSMYGQGYDFRHFCAMTVPVMITEVVVRVAYFIKRLCEGYSFKESIPFGNNREKKPKLNTMLFIAHSAATAINTGKVALTKNPLNINYPQWISFAGYSVKQLKWALLDKPELRDKYVMGFINGEWDVISSDIDELWQNTFENANAIFL